VRKCEVGHLLLLTNWILSHEKARVIEVAVVVLSFERLIQNMAMERVAPLVQKHRRNKLIFPLVYIERVKLGG
jgi:hypothetical protein